MNRQAGIALPIAAGINPFLLALKEIENPMKANYILRTWLPRCCFIVFLLSSMNAVAASSRFLGVQGFALTIPEQTRVLAYSINLVSYNQLLKATEIKAISKLQSDWLYFVKVEVNGKIYYRLVMGNYASSSEALKALVTAKKYFPGAWINRRNATEIKQLKKLLSGRRPTAVKLPALARPKAAVTRPKISANRPGSNKGNTEFADKLLEQSRTLLLDEKYAELIQVSEKVIEIGSPVQQQKAMEFEGIARERQRKFSQAKAIYQSFLKQFPESKIAPRIRSRLQGLTTMRLQPKTKLVKKSKRKKDESWRINGSVSQYYQDNTFDNGSDTAQRVNSSLLSDVSLFARRSRENTTWLIRFDGGMVNDFLDDTNEGDISRAMVRYTNGSSGYELIGGRQSRTVKGVLGRFDGLVLNLISNPDIEYSLYAGYPVASPADSVETSRQFIGGGISIKPIEKMEMDIYLMQQQIDGLTDRQALGTEIQYRSDKGFLYSIVDYDLFYKELNDVTAIANYRYSNDLIFNLTFDYRNAPWLATLNALQGQAVTTIDELQTLFSEDDIYQLAKDRTSKNSSLFFGTFYQIDPDHQLDVSITLSSIDATVSSGGVEAVDESKEFNLLASYSINGFFRENDFTSFATSISDTTNSNNVSLRFRTRFPVARGLRYDPRIQLDYRKSKTTDVNQWILRPSFKVKYKLNRKTSLEGTVGVDYSNFNLPELNDQIAYNLFFGYNYYFQ